MRLTCPNCGAQYEVPDEVIPETGRDVQCSNCGDTWFQHHPDHPPAEDSAAEEEQHPGWDSPEEEAEENLASDETPDEAPAQEEHAESDDDADEDVPDEAPELEPEQDDDTPEDTDAEDNESGVEESAEADEDVPTSEPEDSILDDHAREGDDDTGMVEEDPPRRGLDPAVAELLREEATREEDIRATEGSGLETQPDLGLDSQPDGDDERSQQVKSRMARLRGLPEDSVEEEAEVEPDPSLISRRNLLPDIDEINSSLDSESVRSEAAEADGMASDGTVVRKGSFGRGFTRGVLLVVLLVLLYLLAPTIAEKVPALSGALGGYVDLVNSGRLWLSDMLSGAAPK